jgi:hypothetical protein
MFDLVPWLVTFLFGTLLIYGKIKAKRAANVEGHSKYQDDREIDRILNLQRCYIDVLRREIANIIMNDDINRFQKAFNYMIDWQSEIIESDAKRVSAEMNLLLVTFANYEDFDIISTRHCVPYSRSWLGIDDYIERYILLSKFLIVESIENKSEKDTLIYSEMEIEVFNKQYVIYKDKSLENHIKEGMKRFDIWNYAKDSLYENYNDEEYSVSIIGEKNGRPFSPTTDYGVTCKLINEFGVMSIFHGDDKTFTSYYRSDKAFRSDIVLHT